MSDFFTIFSSTFLLRNALWGSVAVGLVCPLIGVYFMLRRMVLFGVALPEVSAAGIAFVFFLQGLGLSWTPHPGESNDKVLALLGSTSFTLAAIFLMGAMERRGESTVQNRIGALFAAASAATILLVSANPSGEIELLSMLKGEIVSVATKDLMILGVAYATLVTALLLFNRRFLLVSFDREFALSLGRKVLVWDVLLYGIIGVAISMSVLIVGPTLTFAALVVPPLAVRRFCRNMTTFFVAAGALGGGCGLIGFYLSYHWDQPLGPTNIAVFITALLLAVAVRRLLDVRLGRKAAQAI